jgi:hypothetical protein
MNEKWIELEYAALRSEILALGEAERAAVKFYIPAAAIVYAAPYYLLRQPSSITPDPPNIAFLWIFCVVVAGLLTLAMLQSLYWSVDGARRIGTYIKCALEKRSGYGLRWETIFFALTQGRFPLPSDSSAVALLAISVNLVAAVAIGITFLEPVYRWWPLVAAVVLAAPAISILVQLLRSAAVRRRYEHRYSVIVLALKDVLEPDSTAG